MFISDDIANKIKELKPFYHKMNFPKIFTWEELESLLNLTPFVNTTRFNVAHGPKIGWEVLHWTSDRSSVPPSIIEDIIRNYHCYLSDGSRVNKQINDVCAELEHISKGAVDAHIYFNITKTLEGGFGIHWDKPDNFIVQIEGQTNFKVWNVVAGPEEKFNKVEKIDIDPVIDVVMNPGDVIFIPARFAHKAVNITKRMSISFPISPGKPQNRNWVKI